MRVLITGGQGFVGRHLTQHLTEMGDDVTVADREVDVTDRPALVNALSTVAPDVIYHLAAMTSVAESWSRPAEYTRVNVLGTAHLLDAAYELVPEARVVLVSSAEVYGIVRETDLPLTESSPTVPANPYSTSKLEAEHVARDAVRSRHQEVVIARPFNHIGPGQSPVFVVPALVQRMLDATAEGRHFIMVGDLSTRRDFSDVRDVVRAYRLLAEWGRAGEAYNVASGHEIALSDLADELRRRINPDLELLIDPDLLRPVEVPVSRGSFDKLHEATGWEPTFTMAQSLNDVIAAQRGH
ncbi:MAG: NAD-dependent epimerase/dehydratase family protein [Acidimicrobiaceae bacterium]|nr:NAD-dependent epimerase/dehydratase family protein [Acidimicrobiaceae bacterium]